MKLGRPVVALLSAEAFSITGTRLSTIAIPWLVLVTTGDAILTGAVAMAEMLPYVLAKAVGGPMIDRLGAKRVAVLLDVLSVPVLALVPLLHLADQLSIQLLFPVVAVLGLLRGPADAAKHALAPEVAEVGGLPLERVTGLSGAVERFGSTAGAALAGGVVAVLGPTAALGINAATFCIAALVLSWGVPGATPTSSEAKTPEGAALSSTHRVRGYLAELREGWTFLRGDQVLVGITVMVALTNLLDQAYTVVLVPVWAQQTGVGASAIGLVFAVFSGFSILGAVLASVWAERLPRLPVYAVAFILTGLPRYLALGLEAPLALLLPVLAIGGFASGFINPILGAVIFERIPKELRGRVSALNTSLCWSLIPFGGLLGGVLIAWTSTATATIAIGAAYFLTTLVPLARKSFREFGRRPDPSVAGSESVEQVVVQETI
ncbi:MFS transporter [Demetria terragena]|uniref:MFS transporter n=1 Tax=Demetria terragena TaxID=63959 RepID=UPI0003671A40|nr:MFS transporter [Demetria terragena]